VSSDPFSLRVPLPDGYSHADALLLPLLESVSGETGSFDMTTPALVLLARRGWIELVLRGSRTTARLTEVGEQELEVWRRVRSPASEPPPSTEPPRG
jgi:hypothetical protein